MKRNAIKQRDLTGQKFNKLTVIKPLGNRGKGTHYMSLVRCDCGKDLEVRDTQLIHNHILSCRNCSRKTHGMTKTSLFTVWQSMKARCYNPNNRSYSRYGGRGIRICEEWKNNFSAFSEWALANGYKEGLQIDRKDNNGNYEPSNCHFITQTKNARNKESTIYIHYEGELLTIGEVAEITHIRETTLYQRLFRYSWNEYDATHIPTKGKKPYQSSRMKRVFITSVNTGEKRQFQSLAQASLFLGHAEGYLAGQAKRQGNVFEHKNWTVEIDG